MSIDSSSRIIMTVMGQELDFTVDSLFTYQFDIGAVDSTGTVDVTGTYYQITLDAPTGFGMSAGPDLLIAENDAAHGKSFTFKLRADGTVSNVRENDLIVKSMLEELDETLLKGTSVEDQIRGQMDDSAVRQELETLFRVYPPQPIIIGDTWNNELGGTAFVPTVTRNAFSLEAWDAGLATVNQHSMVSTIKGERTAVGGMSLQFDLSGTGTGETQIDEVTGWIRRSNSSTRISGTGIVEGGMLPQPMQIPMTVRATVKIETVRGN